MNSSATTGRVSGDISVATTCPTAVTQATKTTAVGFPSCFVFFLKVYYDPPPLSSFFLIRNQLFANIFFFYIVLIVFYAIKKTGGSTT
jgi:hypothetical protein